MKDFMGRDGEEDVDRPCVTRASELPEERQRAELILERIRRLREAIGPMPDSVAAIRESRDRDC